jgi:hypothetical protein
MRRSHVCTAQWTNKTRRVTGARKTNSMDSRHIQEQSNKMEVNEKTERTTRQRRKLPGYRKCSDKQLIRGDKEMTNDFLKKKLDKKKRTNSWQLLTQFTAVYLHLIRVEKRG